MVPTLTDSATMHALADAAPPSPLSQGWGFSVSVPESALVLTLVPEFHS